MSASLWEVSAADMQALWELFRCALAGRAAKPPSNNRSRRGESCTDRRNIGGSYALALELELALHVRSQSIAATTHRYVIEISCFVLRFNVQYSV